MFRGFLKSYFSFSESVEFLIKNACGALEIFSADKVAQDKQLGTGGSLLVLDKFLVHLKNGQPYLLLCKTLIEGIEGAKEVEGSAGKDPRASGRFAQSWTGTAWG